ncbi:6439_t:CDS:2 [Entrophospora sp. SA101]|nr:6439_t:CDS:2 [Entrophospora sp. SA101]
MKPLFNKVKTATIEQTKKLGKRNFKDSYKSFAIPPGYAVPTAKKFKDIDDGNLSEGEIYDSSNSSDLKLPRSPYPSSTYEDILDLRSPSSNNNVHQLRRTVSFSDLEVSRKHDLKMAPTRIIMDIQTYTIYVDLKQKEASLKNLIEQLM